MSITTTYTDLSGLARSTGQTLSATFWEQLVSSAYGHWGTLGYIGAHVYNSANISISNNSNTALTFDSERFDSDPNGGIHSTGSNTSRLTCQTAGAYIVGGNVSWAANATGTRQLQIRKNGTTVIAFEVRASVGAGTNTVMHVATPGPVVLAATDYVELMAYQDSGGALNALVAGDYSCEFGMVKV